MATRKAIPKRYPNAQAGNYAAPVDTAGMDSTMMQTLGVAPGQKTMTPWEKLMALFTKKPSSK